MRDIAIGDVVIDKATAQVGFVTEILAGTLYITFFNGQSFSYRTESVTELSDFFNTHFELLENYKIEHRR